MRLHRFYVPDGELQHDFWLHEPGLINQWQKVLRFQPGQEVILFDGQQHERLYRIVELTGREAHVQLITDFVRQLPKKNLYLFWAILKSDKNELVLQKGTELGVSHFIPLLAERSEKTGFNEERAKRIIIEAAEQCGRSDIPTLRGGPLHPETAVQEYQDKVTLFIAEQQAPEQAETKVPGVAGIFIGPEGGWSDEEKAMFARHNLLHLKLHDFTLRAETAAISAVQHLLVN